MPGVHTIFTAEWHSVTRAFHEIASGSRKTARVLTDDSLSTQHAFDRTRSSAHKLGGVTSLIGGTLGFGGLALGLKDTTQGAVQLQTAQTQLQASLKATGQAAGGMQSKLQDYAESLSTRGGFSTPQNIKALTQFVGETHNATKSQQLLALSTEIARRRGVDLGAAQKMVQRAYTGSIGRLQQFLGPMVKVSAASANLTDQHLAEIQALHTQALTMGKAGHAWLAHELTVHRITKQQQALATLTDKHATATEVLAAANRAFAGSTSTYAKTSAGHMENMRHAVQNLQEQLGKGLLPIMNKIIGIVAALVGWLAKNRVVLYTVLGAVAAVSAVLVTHSAIVAIAEAKNYLLIASNRILGTSFATTSSLAERQTLATEALAAGNTGAAVTTDELAVSEGGLGVASGLLAVAMDAIPILALVTGIVLLITHFKQVKAVVLDVVHFIAKHWKLFAVGGALFLGGPFTALAVLVATNFGFVKRLVGNVVGFIGKLFKGLLNILTWPFREAWKVIKRILELVKGAATTIGNALGFGGSGLLSYVNPVGVARHVANAFGGTATPRGPITAPHFAFRNIPRHALGGPVGGMGPIDSQLGYETPGEYILRQAVVNQVGTPALNRLNATGQMPGGNITIEPGVVQVRLNERVLAEGVVRYTLRRAARGPSSLVGGALSTGAVSPTAILPAAAKGS